MPRFSLSEDNVFAIEIKAALLAAYTLEFGIPMCALIEPFSTMVLPEFSSVVSAFIRKRARNLSGTVADRDGVTS